VAFIGGILFVSAGRIDLPFFWAYLGVLVGTSLLTMLTVSPELLQERAKPADGGRDSLVFLRVAAGITFVGEWVIAGLDVGRFHGSATVPPWLQGLGLVGIAGFFGVWYWAMRVNPFFSVAVRIQRDRGHHVISSGPYRFVRHPGYATFIVLGVGGPLALGSWWAAVPHIAAVALFVRRAAMEDRMLHDELEGYADYAGNVRYRLIPGVW